MEKCTVFLLIGVFANTIYGAHNHGYYKLHKHYRPQKHVPVPFTSTALTKKENEILKAEINVWNRRAELAFLLGTDELLKLLSPDMIISRPFINPFAGKKGLPENFNRIKRLGAYKAKFTIFEAGKMGLGDQVFQRGKIEYFDKTNRRIDEKSVSGNIIMTFKRIKGELFPISACVYQLE